MLKVGSDFSGIGAFNQALIKIGVDYEEIFACDKDKYVRETFIENYGEPLYYPEDVYKREIPVEPLDIYMTSPPCQSFSTNGLRKGEADERGVLFYNSLEFISKNRPKTFIFENVKGLVNHDKGNTFKKWIDSLNELGEYNIYYKILNGLDFNIPQKRERIFIVGIRKDLNKIFNFPKPNPFTNYLENILEKENKKGTFYLEDLIYDNTFNDFVRLKTPTKLGYIDARFKRDAINFAFPKSKTRRGRVGVNYAQTIDTQCNQGIAIDGSNFRRFTINECVKLFGFNEDFKPNKNINQAYKQFGNSIIVDKLEAIIKQLI